MDTESYSLLLHVTSCEVGGALVAHCGLQPGGANGVEAPAMPGASSQLCSMSQKSRDLPKCRRTLHSALPPASRLSRKSGTAAYILDVNRNRQNPADLYKLLNIYGIRKYCPIVDVTSSAPPQSMCAPRTNHLNHLTWTACRGYSAQR